MLQARVQRARCLYRTLPLPASVALVYVLHSDNKDVPAVQAKKLWKTYFQVFRYLSRITNPQYLSGVNWLLFVPVPKNNYK